MSPAGSLLPVGNSLCVGFGDLKETAATNKIRRNTISDILILCIKYYVNFMILFFVVMIFFLPGNVFEYSNTLRQQIWGNKDAC